nr:unnamed protein product [Callosobruchus chinensis]
MSRNRNGVSMVMGVPTVRREKQSYLMDTLQNLVDGMTTQEADDALIVVFVGEVSSSSGVRPDRSSVAIPVLLSKSRKAAYNSW